MELGADYTGVEYCVCDSCGTAFMVSMPEFRKMEIIEQAAFEERNRLRDEFGKLCGNCGVAEVIRLHWQQIQTAKILYWYNKRKAEKAEVDKVAKL